MTEARWCRGCGSGIPPTWHGGLCPDCRPTRRRGGLTAQLSAATMLPCEECDGTGVIDKPRSSTLDPWPNRSTCKVCHGVGEIPAEDV